MNKIIPTIILSLAVLGCQGGNPNNPNGTKGGPDTKTETVFAVNTVKAVRGQINDYLELNGDVETQSSVDVYAEITTPGKLTKLLVNIGERVIKDQVIAEVDPSRPGSTFIPSQVKAPIDGTITALPAQIGSTISQGVSIARITSTDQIQIRTDVAERFVSKMRAGLEAILRFEAVPGVRFTARVAELSPVLDPSSRTMEVKIKLTQPDTRIKPGMFARVKIITDKKEQIVKIPAECLVKRTGESVVFVLKAAAEKDGPQTVELRKVAPGIQIDDKLEVITGLKAGEEVVVQGQTLLEDGARVKVILQAEPLSSEDLVQ